MRETERIERILRKIRDIWERAPDLRLTQLLLNAVQPRDPSSELYECEDTVLEKRLDAYIRRLERPF